VITQYRNVVWYIQHDTFAQMNDFESQITYWWQKGKHHLLQTTTQVLMQ